MNKMNNIIDIARKYCVNYESEEQISIIPEKKSIN